VHFFIILFTLIFLVEMQVFVKTVTCSKTAENVYSWESSWHSRHTVDIDKTVWYQCYSEYVETSPTGRATCTRRGWEPNPLCKEKPCTTQPHIENGEMLSDMMTEYDHGESLQFRCEGERTTFSVTCQSGEWEKEKSCEGKCAQNRSRRILKDCNKGKVSFQKSF
uniref:Sushi domain-containing protein n=1 Tax=Neogobius melanostomus TaxID=47308 RepID=A0A8C6UQ64_9GOBI